MLMGPYLQMLECRESQIQQSFLINPLPDMPILGSSNPATNKDMISKIWPNVGFNYLIE